MNTSVLLRLLPVSRTGARLAGVAAVVETGQQAPFRDAEQLLEVLRGIQVGPMDATMDGPPGRDVPAADKSAPDRA